MERKSEIGCMRATMAEIAVIADVRNMMYGPEIQSGSQSGGKREGRAERKTAKAFPNATNELEKLMT